MFLNNVKKKKQRTQRVQARNQTKTRQTERTGNAKRQDVQVGECEKFPQRNATKKASEVRLFREIAQRFQCPEGSRKWAKSALHEWHLSFHVFAPKRPPWEFRPRKKKKRKSTRDCFSWRRGRERIEKMMKKEEKKRANMRSTTKALKKEPRMPYSVRRGGGYPRYKYSVKHVFRLEI